MKDCHQPSLLWFIRESLSLDFKFLKITQWSFSRKVVFLLKKYYLLFLYLSGIRKFSLGQSFVNLFGRKIFFDCRFGLAGYQATLARHQKMINVGGVKEIRTVIDVGANVGLFSMLIRERFPEATIYAIEPVRRIFRALRKNFRGDAKTVAINKAISDFCGSSKMVFDENCSGLSHLVDKNIDENGKGIIEDVEVQTLDAFVQEHGIGVVDILKIDVETFEKHVLEGARNTLEKTRYLVIEVTMEDNANYSFSELIGLLYSKGRYNYQLKAFRNFIDKGEGEMPTVDFLFENIQQ